MIHRNNNLYTFQRNYNEACKPIDWNQYNHWDCGRQDWVYEARQDRIHHLGEKLADHEQFLRQTIDLFRFWEFEFEFWSQMCIAAAEAPTSLRADRDWSRADAMREKAYERFTYYSALIQQELGDSLSAMREDDADDHQGPKPHFERFHIFKESNGFWTVFSDNDIPF